MLNNSPFNHNLSTTDLVKKAQIVLTFTAIISVLFGASANFYFTRQAQIDSIKKSLLSDFEKARSSIFTYIASGYNQNDPSTIDVISKTKTDLGLYEISLVKNESCTSLSQCFNSPSNIIWHIGNLGSGNLLLVIGKEKPIINLLPLILGIVFPMTFFIIGLFFSKTLLESAFFKLLAQQKFTLHQNQTATTVYLFIHELKNMIQPSLDELNEIAPQLKSDRLSKTVKSIEATFDKAKDLVIEFLNSNKDRLFNLKHEEIKTHHDQYWILGKAFEDAIIKYKNFGEINEAQIYFFLEKNALLKFVSINSNVISMWLEVVISNALIHAIPRSTRKDIEIFTELNSKNSTDYCNIVIKDYGPHFSEEVKKRLHLGQAITPKKGETNIGLLGVKTSLEFHGGFFKINESNSEYKLVELTIPLVKAPEWHYELSKINRPIIILDDDLKIIDRIKNTVSTHLSNRITIYKNETDFLTAAKKYPDYFLIVDHKFQLRGKTGFQLIIDEGFKNRAVLLTGEVPADRSLIKKSINENILISAKDYILSNLIEELGE